MSKYSDKYLISEWRTAPKRAIRDGVGEALVKIGEDERVVVLSADLAGSTRVDKFAETFPDRFFELGVAEQNMAGVAAGVAFTGLIPFMASYAAFSPGRNWEQIRISIALSKANVKIIGSHGGVATGKNGPSHQGTEDIALTRVLPNMTVLTPADATQCQTMIEAAYKLVGPVYIRTARPETPNFTKKYDFEIGKIEKYREGRDVTICASGIPVWESLMVAEELAKEGVECEVLNISTIKPLDRETIIESARKTNKVITIEDHQIAGGMGSAIAELLGEEYPVPIKRMGITDKFGLSGEWEEVYKWFGLDRVSLKKAVVDYLHE
ncbi:MAG: tkt, transketolase, transketolase [Microgenomates group bacterium GW2011_GWC1_46_16]|uniref:Transketolase-like pyrimidine-binding domain-containing protein n=2 Tax=Candidatus Collieribacteriota TaxID=1752725 RepID=A0A1F5FXN1_9BACT|nr:MAG: Transketolase, pyridine binding domain protein [Microgenomates group bacterium GW2011_GWF1_46_12]KKU27098.1 MAG: tkt, transketolase, transketolase [Microgenomates group bacterium GW2011_GWC1_46_16]KKU27860.1 MAG: Transketolase, pyridine binding domain protein [Microgenomates group bacterium GW2011_GWF2_46_18]KKU45067.1 MAG: Transketolase, pyridine binding domain protein [Microgenomates group bacterium GW2011_GWB1_46_7]KKU60838.1 MAG: Transketolase, pyridine binding domain protein [Micro